MIGYLLNQERMSNKIVEMMNDIVRHEPETLDKLIQTRVPCGKYLDEHPCVQTMSSLEDPEQGMVGLLGMINGILVALECPKIQATWDNDDKLIGFGIYTPISTIKDLYARQNLLGHKEK